MEQSDFIFGYYFNQNSESEKIPSLAQLDEKRPHWLHFDYTLDNNIHIL